MIKDLTKEVEKVLTLPNFRTRSKLTFYATDAGRCSRELFWQKTGVKPTNDTDFLGMSRMKFGSAIGDSLINDWFRRLGVFGFHVLEVETAVGGVNPDWNGAIDVITGETNAEGKIEVIINELKSTWGAGADFLLSALKPKEDHLYQIGLYLKDIYEKRGKLHLGRLYYFLISDKNMCQRMQFECTYNPANNTVSAIHVSTSTGVQRPIQGCTLGLNEVFERWLRVEKAIHDGIEPKSDYVYKYALTSEVLDKMSDSMLLKCIDGSKIYGDWQLSYSSYKDLHLKTDGTGESYTPEEIEMFVKEYKKRHPYSKKF